MFVFSTLQGKTRAEIKQERIENEVPALQRGSWAKLLARVFMIDVTRCAQCGGEVEAIAGIFERSITSKIKGLGKRKKKD